MSSVELWERLCRFSRRETRRILEEFSDARVKSANPSSKAVPKNYQASEPVDEKEKKPPDFDCRRRR
jgi:hypothetical protein